MKKNTEPKRKDVNMQPSQVESQETAEVIEAKSKANSDALCVVIPYAKEFYSSEALQLAIRSWFVNFIGKDFKIVVVGDIEDWFSDELLYIPLASTASSKNEFHWKVACAALFIDGSCDDFIFAEPDTFLVNPICYSHIEIHKGKGLDQLGMFNFDTGLPFSINKEMLACLAGGMVDGFPKTDIANGCLHASELTHPIQLDWKTDNWMLPVVNKQPDVNRFEDLVSKKCFMKAIGDGWSPFLLRWLVQMFPDQSIYEK